MDSRQVIRETLAMADLVAGAYLKDLTDEQLHERPHANCNTIYWQLGHLILSEHNHMCRIDASAMPALPEQFAVLFSKENGSQNLTADLVSFSKQQLLEQFKNQRQATLKLLDQQSDEMLDIPSGVPYAPTRAALFHLQGSHWLMHAGQWVIVRRNLEKPVAI
ncbi:MAG: DinB family protein [Pirellulales bacterium]